MPEANPSSSKPFRLCSLAPSRTETPIRAFYQELPGRVFEQTHRTRNSNILSNNEISYGFALIRKEISGKIALRGVSKQRSIIWPRDCAGIACSWSVWRGCRRDTPSLLQVYCLFAASWKWWAVDRNFIMGVVRWALMVECLEVKIVCSEPNTRLLKEKFIGFHFYL